ncbi:Inner membrane amino-acid ABC transporter permease protein YhdY [Agrobacterium sp. DSM 25558]|uniref:amino acid ABC transporter permease n=1 Tax=Agrobacterium sp. DSM 25558 TaxID=1907665 RepID=UPI0009724874|nr:amino acid ABC transporter permease [Agrobacterium sp. DSM 25558]SCX22479.1 Inner membrane amino-acid ABC transporter permease protein YhdY [Agrobacterium sp. DSM 25558]
MSEIDLPPSRAPEWRLWQSGLFGGIGNTAVTVVTLAVLLWLLAPVLRWLLIDAVWSGTAQACGADTAGACWVFIGTKLRFVLFGFFPPDLQWRPAVVVLGIAVLLVFSALPRFWTIRLIPVWLAALVLSWLLMAGTIAPPSVSTNHWGGLPITLGVAIAGLAFAFPIALLLALARQSNMGLLRICAIAFIEVLRGIPMIAVLYIAMLIVPMAVPGGSLIDKLLRAQIGVTLFFSAYLAEVIRAGLQVVPTGQTEAAAALGFGYWKTTRLIVLPQALRAVIPAVVNLSIGILLNTSLLAVIGIFDLLNTARTAATDPLWLGFYTESYVFTALIYFIICFSGSRYSLWLERYLRRSQRG